MIELENYSLDIFTFSHRTSPTISNHARGVVSFEVPQYTKGDGREDEYKLDNVFRFAAIESDDRAHGHSNETHGEAYIVALHDNEYEQIERRTEKYILTFHGDNADDTEKTEEVSDLHGGSVRKSGDG